MRPSSVGDRFTPVVDPRLAPTSAEGGVRMFRPEGAGFELTVVEEVERAVDVGGPAVLALLAGNAVVGGTPLAAPAFAYLDSDEVRVRASSLAVIARGIVTVS